ncbi:MAG: hypothetical protein F6J92_28575, partial [Symploca sp. SIO1A3]|nr:hypothetical protein [Symploca sp. SIO1A3]
GTNQRFVQRLSKMEAVAERPLSDYTLDELEYLWQQAKTQLAHVPLRFAPSRFARSRFAS